MPRRVLLPATALLAFGALPGCTRSIELEVRLAAVPAPDPFQDVARVEAFALGDGRLSSLGGGRWDQGPLALVELADPHLARVYVRGLAADGRLVSSGVSAPLDLLRAERPEEVQVVFSRVGVISPLGARAPVRRGAGYVELSSGALLVVGGEDEAGCDYLTTELYRGTATEDTPGPTLEGGRAGDFRAMPLSGDRVLVLGGTTSQSCGPGGLVGRPAMLDVATGSSRLSSGSWERVRPSASVVLVSESLAVVAGGDDELLVSSEIVRLDPRSLEVQAPAQLSEPRADAAGEPALGGRVVLLGGRSLRNGGVHGDAVVLDPSRGAMSAAKIPLSRWVLAPASVRTSAGTVILAGGLDAGEQPAAPVSAVVVQPERALSFGDTSTVAVFGRPPGEGRLIDAGAGRLLFLPAVAAPLAMIDLLPALIAEVSLPQGFGAVRGGRLVDGTVLLRDDEGQLALFNPGPAGPLGLAGAAEAFRGAPAGLVPQRPAAWRWAAPGVLEGRLLPELPAAGVSAQEKVMLGDQLVSDFDLAFTLALEPLARGALVFGDTAAVPGGGAYDAVLFSGMRTVLARVAAAGNVEPLPCDFAETPALIEGPHVVRVRRAGGRVEVDLGDDGSLELACSTPDPEQGRVGFGVAGGVVRFAALTVASAR